MQYELFNWEKSIAHHADLAPDREWMEESARIKGAFMEVLLGREPEETIERYVQTHQTGLLHLSVTLGEQAETRLGELFDFLERFCGNYLSKDAPLPDCRSRKFAFGITQRIPALHAQLQGAGVEEVLTQIIIGLFESAVRGRGSLTYRQWFPLRELMEYIQRIPQDEKDNPLDDDLDPTTRLMEVLYYLNINTLPVYRYAKLRMEQIAIGHPLQEAGLAELSRLQRYFNWLEHKPGYRYKKDRGSVVKMLSVWAEDLVHRREKGAAGEVVPAASDDDGFGLDSKKVITSLTVNELGLLLRLFMETGVFRTRNRKGLASFMAQNVVTLKKEAREEVSINHLYGSLYSTTDATMDSVQAILNRMLGRLAKFRVEQRNKRGLGEKTPRAKTPGKAADKK